MKTFRVIWAVATIILMIAVCAEWQKQGCEVWQLAVAVIFYGCGSTAVYGVVNETIKELKNR